MTPIDLAGLMLEFALGILAAGVIAAVVILATAVVFDVRRRRMLARRPRGVVIVFDPSVRRTGTARARRGAADRRAAR
jgi:hypothetical protein